ncbi:MAG: disulfide bond formation protein B [bacterium]
MESFISFWNGLMALAVFGGIAAVMGLLYTLILPNDSFSRFASKFVAKNILIIGFLLSLSALLVSLVYSEVIGYPPCLFCWWARVMFYPQFFLFGRALWKKDFNILPYSLILTAIGTIIGIYHSIIVLVGESVVPCTVSGVSCLTRDVYMFGFITIPMMSLTGFAVLLFCLLVAKKSRNTNS